MKEQKDSNRILLKPGFSWLISFPGCAHYTDAQATAILDSLFSLAVLLLDSPPCSDQALSAGKQAAEEPTQVIPLLPKQKAA